MNDLIMIVEDDPYISHFLQMSFEQEGYRILMTSQGHEALSLFYSHQPDIVILDLGLPDMDGLEIIEEIRKISAKPIIVVSARLEEQEKIKALDLGANDYVVKPFDPTELMARVRAVLKRYSVNTSNIIKLNDVEFDGEKYEIRYLDETIHLPLKQFELVFELAKHPDQIFSREQLIEKIWGMDYDGFDRTVDVHIKRIRENLGHLPGFKVVTVRGLGYKVEVE